MDNRSMDHVVPYDMEQPFIFISYSHQDKNLVYPIINKLAETNCNLWWDNGIPHSEDYHETIAEHIRQSNLFIAFLSNNYTQSTYCQIEAKYAFTLKKKIVPVYLEKGLVLSDGLEMLFTNLQAIFYTSIENCVRQIENSPTVKHYFSSMSKQNNMVSQLGLNQSNVTTYTPKKKKLRESIFCILAITGIFFPLIWIYILHNVFNLPLRIVYSAILIYFAWWLLDEIETNPQMAASCFGTIQIEELFKKPEILSSSIAGAFGDHNFISTIHHVDGFECLFKWTRLEFGSWDNQNTNYLYINFIDSKKICFSFESYDPSIFYLHSLSRGTQAIKMLTRQGFILQDPLPNTAEKMHFLKNGSVKVLLCYKKKRLSELFLFNCSDAEFERRLLITNEELTKKFNI